MDKKENIETAKTEERKPSLDWNKQYVIFFVLPIILIILVPLGGIFYLCGRMSWHIGMVFFMFNLPAGVFIIYCFFASIRLFGGWRKHTWRKRILIVTEIVIPVVFIVLFIIPFFIPIKSAWPPSKAFTYGFRNRMKSKADIEAIRDWLGTLDKEDYDVHGNRLHPDKWPKSLKALKPVAVSLLADKNGNPQVRLMWGAAIFHWGFVVGMEDMEIPPSHFNQRDEYWLLVEPGVYVWDQ